MRLVPRWREGGLAQPRDIDSGDDVGHRVDRIERAFQAELTSSMSLNVRGTAVAAVSAIAILLLAEFSTTWLDDSRWKLPPEADLAMKIMLPAGVGLLALCIVLSIVAVWPKRRWGTTQRDRLDRLGAGDAAAEARLLLQMVESQRVVNERRSFLLRITAVPLAIALVAIAGQCLVFAFWANPRTAVRGDAPEEVKADDATGLPSPEEQARLAGEYAPRVHLHPKERFGPIDPLDFLRGSRLVWRERRASTQVAGRGKVDPARLGRDCGGNCYRHEGYLARELTRPFQPSKDRPRALEESRGFALEPDGEARRGRSGRNLTVPMLWEFRKTSKEVLITYWFYYGYSRPNDPRAELVSDLASHDGDWENVDVALEPDHFDRPLAIYFYGHGDPKRRAWSQACKLVGQGVDCTSAEPGHPIVYSALSSHASYPEPGRVTVSGKAGTAVDETAEGPVWDTWDEPGGLRPVKGDGWYGFGGAWGRAKQIEGTAGPLGPSRWKLPADPDPGDLASHGP